MVAPVVEMLKIEARQKEIRVNVINNLNDSFREVFIDKTKTQQILINLLRNAIKFSSRCQKIEVIIS